MAICKKCGAQIPDGSKFCEYCGTVQDENPQAINPQTPNRQAPNPQNNFGAVPNQQTGYGAAPNQQQSSIPQNYGYPGNQPAGAPKKKMSAKRIAIIAAVAAAVIAIVMIYGYIQKGINIGDYVQVKYTGGNGHATANANIDYDKLSKTVLMKEKGKLSAQKILALTGEMSELESSIKIDLDKEEKLSNNDKVKATVTCDKNILKKMGIHFTNTSKTFTVSGLKDLISLDPFKDVRLECKGFEGNGTAELVNNSSDKILANANYSADKTVDLSNGDAVTVMIKMTEAEAEKKGYTFSSVSKTYTVSGLKDLTSLDPFQDITVEFKGFAPNCTAKVINSTSNNILKNAHYEIDKKDHLNIGDVVTVKVKLSDSDLAEQGYKLSGTSKTFKLDKADKYITSVSEISEAFMESMKKEASDTIESSLARNWTSTSVLGDLKYSGYYFLAKKNPSSGENINSLFIIYTGTDTDGNNIYETQTLFFPIEFKNLTEISSGTQLYDSKSDIIGSFHASVPKIGGGTYDYGSRGYLNGTDMFKDIVVKNKEDFTYEVSPELVQFGK